ncbi:aldehyde dehydrogenase [Cantharellus anzutake]|uniref:aldehyde dehydrogenase n=1 Tax=Cantharellus anzutake TaxID=1750568 RepID=UPI001906CFCC|nr:aldehyde dehydrogenase [Cantharellus anzutake]KAF8332682.1 aldehyde dehydrogenase [Cantharellus anzutake]
MVDCDRIAVRNPASGELLASVNSPSSQEITQAVNTAQAIFTSGEWSQAPHHKRADVLSRISLALANEVTDLARLESSQTGRTIREMNAQLGRLPEWLEYYASLLRTVPAGYFAPTKGPLLNIIERVPLGVVAQITPFNHPLLIAIKKIAPALAAGNSVIVKPSELAPLSVLRFAELSIHAGLPSGVLTVLPGGPNVAKELISHRLVRKVDITAGTSTGRAIGGIVGANLASYTAELGGKAPIIVFSDSDMQSAINGVAFSAFVASGQTCVSGARLILQDEIYDDFMGKLVRKVESITRRMGDPLNPSSTMGTVIHEKQLRRIQEMLGRISGTSARISIGGERLTGPSTLDGFLFDNGSFFAPTIVEDISTEDELWREEIFGPVLVVKRFKDEEEAVTLANDSKYGLGAGVWTRDLSRAHRVAGRIEAGLVWVNTHHRNDPSSPWGGMKESGIGRENGVEAYNAYSQSKSTIINVASVEATRAADDWFAEDDQPNSRYG